MLYNLLPKGNVHLEDLFGNPTTCAILSSSKILFDSEFGSFIDKHDVVLRLNNGFQNLKKNNAKNLGCNTTHIMLHDGTWNRHLSLNDKINIRKETFIFAYEFKHIKKFNIANLTATFVDFLTKRNKNNADKAYILSPEFWKAADNILKSEDPKESRELPSSGFLALVLLSQVCKEIDAFGFSDLYVNKDYKPFNTRIHNFKQEHRILRKWNKSKETKSKLNLYPR